MSDFLEAVLAGLRTQPRVIPARYFYDAEGSRLFEEITRLPKYYPTRTEIAILRECLGAVAQLAGRGRAVVEFGSGSSEKTPPLLNALASELYIPVDISPSALEGAAAMLAESAPGVAVHPVIADFMGDWAIPDESERFPLLGFFPGSTIGNLVPAAAVDLLRRFRARLGEDAAFLIGIDRRKDPAVLEAAYDDAQGVTAAFNMNLLTRIAAEIGGEVDRGAWRHRALWRDPPGRIEMRLEAVRDTDIAVGGERFAFAAGDTIHTENSYKYSLEEAAYLARASGWEPRGSWTDAENRFIVQLWLAADRGAQP